jgi:hypothetical protein
LPSLENQPRFQVVFDISHNEELHKHLKFSGEAQVQVLVAGRREVKKKEWHKKGT